MRGSDRQTGSLFSYVNLEERVPARHPLRKIKAIVDAALATLDAEFSALYAGDGRPSIAPERLIRASLLQILFSIRSERQLMEQLEYNLLFRWFVGLSIDEPVWVPTVFTKNRDRLLTTDMSRKFMAAILAHKQVAPLLSDDHFSVDGTLVEAWASFKSFRPKDGASSGEPPADPPPTDAGNADGQGTTGKSPKTERASGTAEMTTTEATSKDEIGRIMAEPCGRNVERDWRGQTWSNATHASVTDPDARLYRKAKGRPAQLCYMGHALMENRNGFVVDGKASLATGTAETDAALAMVNAVAGDYPITVAGDKGYDSAGFVSGLQAAKAVPHIARNTTNRESAVSEAVAATEGYAMSQKFRKRIEEGFGWGKVIGPLRKVKVRGLEKVDWLFKLTMAGYNMIRLRNLMAA